MDVPYAAIIAAVTGAKALTALAGAFLLYHTVSRLRRFLSHHSTVSVKKGTLSIQIYKSGVGSLRIDVMVRGLRL